MSLNRNKLYTILLISCIAGYIWIINSLYSLNSSIEVCLIKHVTGVPCPSCGSTRSVISLAKGDFLGSIFINPLGLVVALIMILAPLWVIFDLITKRHSLFAFYRQIENYLKKPKVLVVFILLVMLNWIWNITKGL
ncbi:DUF2752 domain-containing protein [Gillisia hiemivivida]|uniref:DUF2752 domain-containing protein n=1 Tax=Gillisia hiemivivida TaxID=291190 RepID=A0A5C6ZYE0_9FLAO|nr:DUF2752 domain-containing protein [Gillisia hiemivivida]